MKLLPIIVCSIFFTACNSANIKESFLGFQSKPYQEPEGDNIAYLIVDAPKLKKKMMIEDKISVSFYNSCTDNSAFRNEGYIGGFNLSSKDSIGKSKKVKINVNQPLFVEVGYAEQTVQCTNKFRVLPELNSTYKIHWEYSRGACSAAGWKRQDSGEYANSNEINQQNNKGSFWQGASGRTTSEWRGCSAN